MRYVSTRGQAPETDFTGVLLAGLAPDGGLYMPRDWPHLTPDTLRAWRGLPYPALVAKVMALFTAGCLSEAELLPLCQRAYQGFTHPAITPLVQLRPNLYALELFHGPTLAFKDLALQLVGQLFEHALAARQERVCIVGATSGDTGSAAIAATAGRENLDIVILHPEGKTSAVQRRQMTTIAAENVLNLAVAGNFDDCQDLVKAMFADTPFRQQMRLSAVNSINFARIIAQIPYYVYAALNLGAPERELAVAVPTGNFGNVLAAWAARQMGLPIARFIVASNRNDILTRFLRANDMSLRGVEPSLSPSMDIGVSSNFERLLYAFLGQDPVATARLMQDFRHTGHMAVPACVWQAITALFTGYRLDDAATLAEIKRFYQESGYLADPHSVIGFAAGRDCGPPDLAVIAAATAHPAKFPETMVKAIGVHPPLPPHLADLYEKQETYTRSPASLQAVETLVRNFVNRTKNG